MVALLACSSSAEPQPRPDPRATTEALASRAAAAPTAELEPAPELVEVLEVESPRSARASNIVPVAAAQPRAAELSWREVEGAPAGLRLRYVARGVVGRAGDTSYEIDGQGRFVARPELELPAGSLLGTWPDDVWLVETQPREGRRGASRVEYRAQRLGEDRRWVSKRIARRSRWVAEAGALRTGGRGGLVARDGSRLTRVGKGKRPARLGMRMGKTVVDAIETRSGKVYSFSRRGEGIYVQRGCRDLDCVKEHAKRLPFGTDWSFGMHVGRESKSLSVHASTHYQDSTVHYLLHYGVGGWKLDSLLRAPKALWPAPDGGLWVALGPELCFRSAAGEWWSIALPRGTRGFTAAYNDGAEELWVAVRVGGGTKVFATAAAPKLE